VRVKDLITLRDLVRTLFSSIAVTVYQMVALGLFFLVAGIPNVRVGEPLPIIAGVIPSVLVSISHR
jgi:hypothetical protein